MRSSYAPVDIPQLPHLKEPHQAWHNLRQNGPGLDQRSQLYAAPEVTAAVARIAAAGRVKVAA
jgi:hypothetical protein